MTLLSLILVLLLEQWRPFTDRHRVARPLARLANFLQRHFNAGEVHHGTIAWMLGVVPLLAAGWFVYWLLASVHPLLGLLFNIAVLYLTMGFRQGSHYFTEIHRAMKEGEIDHARELLGRWRRRAAHSLSREDVVRLSIEQALVGAHRHVFGVIFWYAILPGPIGAMLYRLAQLFEDRWGKADEQEFGRFGWFAHEAFAVIDWLPARLTAVSFAVVGDFEDSIYCWRTQAATWSDTLVGVVLASGAGALGVRLGNPLVLEDGTVEERPDLGTGEAPDVSYLDSTVGLLWRALVLWLAMILIITVIRAIS